ncbi:MAG: class A beta-lactamase-related serine hydrolase [Flavobacteriales bacterium]|nr:class A beta-lactamase-related serine hydrolase [Flavobacteriales bacterium]MBK9699050.1 class A beta-lactamase-related serine hydrolase [Flavobacteriales bacterium]
MRYPILLLVLAFAACQAPTRTDDPTESLRRHVETGLCEQVLIEGDSTWTVEERMKHYGVHGVSIAIIDDFKIAWTKSYGVMDTTSKRPVTDSTLFQAASISKPVFAMAVLKLAQQGVLDIDADVNTMLTSWKMPENEFTTTEKVTLKRLLGHVAGTTVHGFQGYRHGDTLPTLLNILNGEAPANSPPVVVDQIPGTAWRYSGGGYCVASQVILDKMGGTIPQHMRDLVLQPLGMSRSSYEQPMPAAMEHNAASGYVPDGSMAVGKWHIYPEISPDGLWTTATDLARFVIDMQKTITTDSGQVLSRATAMQMVEPYLDPNMAVGLILDNKGSERYFEHGGWNEGFCGQIYGHVKNGKGAVVLINANQPAFMFEVMRSIARAYDWPEFVPQRKEVPMDSTSLKVFTGRYRGGSDNMVTIALHNGKLFREPLREPPTELVHIGDGEFIGRTDERSRRFLKDAAGEMTLQVSETKTGDVLSTLPRMKDDEHIPFEYVQRGDRDAALKAYADLKAANPNDEAVNEEALNNFGYTLLSAHLTEQARDLFFINMSLYPKSANVYDSYAEACLKLGDKKQALEYYKRTLSMNPQNPNATHIVAELEKEGVKVK